uniref:Uncharacterized protein n=1 Tax=Arundo donax TaxID=35708 RepID=A0A0A8ZZN2_ARUDO
MFNRKVSVYILLIGYKNSLEAINVGVGPCGLPKTRWRIY